MCLPICSKIKKMIKSTMLISESCLFVSKLAMWTFYYYYYDWYLSFRLWSALLSCWWHMFADMLTKQKTNKLVKPTLLICWIPNTSTRPTRNETKRNRTKWNETSRFPGWAHSPNLSFNMDVVICMYFCDQKLLVLLSLWHDPRARKAWFGQV